MASLSTCGNMRLRFGPFGRQCPTPGSIRRATAASAKKGGKGGSKKGDGGQKKGGGALANLLAKKQQAEEGSDGEVLALPEQYKDPEVLILLLTILSSYTKYTGKFLMETQLESLADAMYKAPFVLLAHDKYQPGVTDPVFTYANRAALRLFEATWDELIGLPSRLSAADDAAEADRKALLGKAQTQDYIEGYEGWRKSLKGTRFKILEAQFFNLRGGAKAGLVGQAVVFDRYEDADGNVCIVEGEAPPPPEEPEPDPTEEDVKAAEQAIAEQAAAVRALKEEQGLTNQDPEVAAAVAELKVRKERLADLQQRLEQAQKDAEAAADYDESALFDDDD